MKGIPNMGQLMKQAQQFQTRMAKLQEDLADKTVEASAGGGMVTGGCGLSIGFTTGVSQRTA